MKKVITIAITLAVAIGALMFLMGHAHDPFEERDVDCEYPGAIVMSKDTFWHCLSLKYKGEIIHTGYYDIQAHYKAGDTINRECIIN